jgi:hypothetical protein
VSSSYDTLFTLLEREREAARRADVDTLLELQEAKRAAIEKIDKSTLSRDRLKQLAEKARSNIWLLRHLVQCLQGAVGEDNAATYTAAGERASPAGGFSRGNA